MLANNVGEANKLMMLKKNMGTMLLHLMVAAVANVQIILSTIKLAHASRYVLFVLQCFSIFC